ncbi:hypothetical protein E4K10_26015 [Streptomyces sp. T1317-0309]|nr:hypothetical protein E4K10_26015 [Streptomyces sp. T1317-0309]
MAQLVDLTVDATAHFAGADHKVLSINAANGGGVPADGLIAFTSAWGDYSRNRGLTGVSNDQIAEVLVRNGSVVSVTPNGPAGSGTIPDDGLVLVGRGAAATAIRALQPGDPVKLDYQLADNAARTMKFALGHGGTIVSGGQVVKGLDTSIAPRTALGFKNGGKTLVLATWDGPGGTGKGGVGIDKEARDLAAMGVETAVNLDGAARPRWSPVRSARTPRPSAMCPPTATSATTPTAWACSSRRATADCTASSSSPHRVRRRPTGT